VARCWEQRGCDAAMQDDCPHAARPTMKCPASCMVGRCDRASRVATSDPALILDVTVDRAVAVMEACLYCEFFLRGAPRVG